MTFQIEERSTGSDPDEYRDWFVQWSKYLPWADGKETIRRRLERLCGGYRAKYDPRRVAFDQESTLFRKLLYSLTFHWTRMKNAPPVDEEATIESLEKDGRGGSNPLDDLTLADSLIAEARENRTLAKRYLEKRFGGFATATARRMNLPVSRDLNDCEWWLDAYYSMVGLSGKTPALGSYAGRAGIGAWIRRVVYSANRASLSETRTLTSIAATDESGEDDPASRLASGDELSASRAFEVEEFRAALREFWLGSSPVERTLLLYWNEKTPKRFARAVRKRDYREAWDVSPNDVREAYKICGVGLKSKKMILALVERRREFLRRFDFDANDAKTFVPLYWDGLVALDREYPVGDEEFEADARAKFGGEV